MNKKELWLAMEVGDMQSVIHRFKKLNEEVEMAIIAFQKLSAAQKSPRPPCSLVGGHVVLSGTNKCMTCGKRINRQPLRKP